MGMFDRIWVDCPKCDTPVEFQSKTGDCLLDEYSLEHCPPDVLRGAIGDMEYCENCGSQVHLGSKIVSLKSIPTKCKGVYIKEIREIIIVSNNGLDPDLAEAWLEESELSDRGYLYGDV